MMVAITLLHPKSLFIKYIFVLLVEDILQLNQ